VLQAGLCARNKAGAFVALHSHDGKRITACLLLLLAPKKSTCSELFIDEAEGDSLLGKRFSKQPPPPPPRLVKEDLDFLVWSLETKIKAAVNRTCNRLPDCSFWTYYQGGTLKVQFFEAVKLYDFDCWLLHCKVMEICEKEGPELRRKYQDWAMCHLRRLLDTLEAEINQYLMEYKREREKYGNEYPLEEHHFSGIDPLEHIKEAQQYLMLKVGLIVATIFGSLLCPSLLLIAAIFAASSTVIAFGGDVYDFFALDSAAKAEKISKQVWAKTEGSLNYRKNEIDDADSKALQAVHQALAEIRDGMLCALASDPLWDILDDHEGSTELLEIPDELLEAMAVDPSLCALDDALLQEWFKDSERMDQSE